MLNIGLDKDFVKIQFIVSILSVSASLIILPFGGALTIAIIWSLSEMIIAGYQVLVLREKGIQIFTKQQFSFNSIVDSLKFVLGR